MLFLLIAKQFDPIVNGIPTTKVEATIGAKLWKDRGYLISGINDELLGAILFQPNHRVNSKTIAIESNEDVESLRHFKQNVSDAIDFDARSICIVELDVP